MSDLDDITPTLVTLDETGETLDGRNRVLFYARKEIGVQDPDKYWRLVQPELVGNPHKVAWCGGFALWCLRIARLCDWSWVTGMGFLYHLKVTRNPEPGDIAYFGDKQHHAIVEIVESTYRMVHTIDGNGMLFPQEGVVSAMHPLSAVTAFYSIESLVK